MNWTNGGSSNCRDSSHSSERATFKTWLRRKPLSSVTPASCCPPAAAAGLVRGFRAEEHLPRAEAVTRIRIGADTIYDIYEEKR